jgi:hypothetical protein
LNDYVRGAFEALSWTKEVLSASKKDPAQVERVLKEIEGAIEDIRSGIAVDFRNRLRTYG